MSDRAPAESPATTAGLIDISVVVRPGTPEWPGDTPYACGWSWEKRSGDSVNVSNFAMSPHVGTHADAPLHVEDGWLASHALPLDAFVGPALVADVGAARGTLAFEDLRLPNGVVVERLLLRTGRTIADGGFPQAWPVLSEACARQLLDRGLRLLGVDAPSVDERESQALPIHHLLFAARASVLENLDLRSVGAGRYELLALPLRLEGLDAAPVRAVLRAGAGG